MKTKKHLKLAINAKPVRPGLTVRTAVLAGGLGWNHSRALLAIG